MDAEYAQDLEEPAKLNLKPCKICGRSFAQEVIVKHTPICQKNAKKKRKVFDSGKQRAAGSDIPYNATLKPGQTTKGKTESPEPAKYAKAHEATRNNWRYKHEQLVSGMRAARGDPTPVRGGGGGRAMGGAPPPMVNPNMSQCKYCGRSFNNDRVEKHESICGEQARRAQKDVGNRARGGAAAARGAGTMGARPGAGPQPGGTRQPAAAPARGGMAGRNGGAPVRTPPSSSSPASTGSPVASRGAPAARQPPARGAPPAAKPGPSPAAAPSGNSRTPLAPKQTSGGGPAKFCGTCGCKFSGTTARFCGECGAARG